MNRPAPISVVVRATALAIAVLVAASAERALAGCAAARDAYAHQQFDEVIAACKGKADHENAILRALALAEKVALYKLPDEKKELSAASRDLEDGLTAGDLEFLAGLAGFHANPNGAALATELMEDVLRRASTLAEMGAVVSALEANPGQRGTDAALRAVARHLERVRSYVSDGGTMPEPERRFFAQDGLLALLVGMLAAKEQASVAQKCLVLIEEPALAPCERLSGREALETAKKIRTAMAAREKKRPGSVWYGTPPQDPASGKQ